MSLGIPLLTTSIGLRFISWIRSIRFVVLLLLSFNAFQVSGQTPTVVMNDQLIIQPDARRIGLNIGAIDYWDNGQILKNLIGTINPGFEPLMDRQIWVVQTAGTTTSFEDPDIYDGVPVNYWTGGTFTVVASQSAGKELGCTGTIASNTGPNPPGNVVTYVAPVYTTTLPCLAPFNAGDIVIVSKTTTPTPESWWEASKGGVWASISGGGKLLSDSSDLCSTCGSQALELDATATGSSAGFSSYFEAAYTSDLFVLMNGTYEITFWAKAASGSPILSVSAQRFSAGGFNCGTQNQSLTSSWAPYTLQCAASESAKTTTPGIASVSFSVTGGAAYLDNTSFQKTGTDKTNTTVLRDEVFNTLKNFYNVQSGGSQGILRDWLGQNGEDYPNWTSPDYAQKPTATGAGNFVEPAGSGVVQLSLEDYLNLCKALGVEPSLEVPVTISTQDATNLIDFLAGPSTSAGGARRAALGQVEPWTSSFSEIRLSFCNECWNGSSFVGQSLPYRGGTPNSEYYYDYSVRAQAVLAAMRASAYYTRTAFNLVIDAQTAVSYSMDAAINRAHPDSIQIENYSYGTVNSFATDSALWLPNVAEVWGQQINPSDPTNYYQSLKDYQGLTTCGAQGNTACEVSIYEWGSGTQTGSIDQTHMDSIEAGAGAGLISALSSLLGQQYHSINAHAYFALTEYQNQALNGKTAKVWGIVVDMGGATNNLRPQYLALSLVNQSIIGPMYSCPMANNVTFNFSGSPTNGAAVPPGVPANPAVPYLYSFCFENGSSRSMVLINADLTASHTVAFSGTNVPSGTVTLRQYAPASPDLLNEAPSGTASNSAIATTKLTSVTLTDPTSLGLPPFSVTAIDFVSSGTSGTTATPVISPLAGSYLNPQTVTISDSTTSAKIYYTTDGTVPTTGSTLFVTPINVGTTETVKAMAAAPGYTNSAVASSLYSIAIPVAAKPAFSPVAGSYPNAQTVTITDSTAGAVIHYTTDGTIPTAASTVYISPLAVSKTLTLNAVAIAVGYTNSTIGSAAYVIAAPVAATPTFSPQGGTYATAQTVSISDSTQGAIIYYTTNGAVPTTTSAVYSVPLTVSSNETVHAFAVAVGYSSSIVGSSIYTIQPLIAAASPTFSPPAGTYTTGQSVALSDTLAGATIYYTTDGSAPSTSSAVYSGPIKVSVSVYVQASAIAKGYSISPTSAAMYSLVVAQPVLSLPSGSYTGAQTVTATDATPGSVINYTIDGTTPTTTSAVYLGPLVVTSSETLKVVGSERGFVSSAVMTATYSIAIPADPPSFSPAAGAFTGTQEITISDTTPGAKIYYEINGGTPILYSMPIEVSSSETILAAAVASGYATSLSVSATYTIRPRVPDINFPSGFAQAAGLLTLNGSSILSGSSLQLTNGGPNETAATWFDTPVSISQFTTDFTFQLKDAAADGITFSIQNNAGSVNAIGRGGSSLGYGSLSKSVAVKFDLHNNSGEGSDSTGLYLNGATPTTPFTSLTGTGIDLHSGDPFAVHINYYSKQLTLTITDKITQAQFTSSWPVDIPSIMGATSGYVGFTGATGGASAIQELLEWTFSSN